jgi:hypothetical protein
VVAAVEGLDRGQRPAGQRGGRRLGVERFLVVDDHVVPLAPHAGSLRRQVSPRRPLPRRPGPGGGAARGGRRRRPTGFLSLTGRRVVGHRRQPPSVATVSERSGLLLPASGVTVCDLDEVASGAGAVDLHGDARTGRAVQRGRPLSAPTRGTPSPASTWASASEGVRVLGRVGQPRRRRGRRGVDLVGQRPNTVGRVPESEVGREPHRAQGGADRARVPRHGGVVEPHGTVDRCLAGVLPSRDASGIAAAFTCR